MKERHIGFAGDRAGQERLAAARRTEKQRAFGDARADVKKFLRVAQKLYNLFEFFFGFMNARNVIERHLFLACAIREFGLRLTERHGAAVLAANLTHQKINKTGNQQKRNEIVE